MIKSAAFLGSKKFGLEIFKALYHAEASVEWTILCPPDEDDVRTHYGAFQSFAEAERLELLPAKSPQAVLDFVRDRSPDVVIVCGYYRLLPAEVFNEVRDGVWGVHNSLLPKYRGGSPLVWQIMNGEPSIGSSFFKFASGVDDGPVLDQVVITDAERLTIKQATDLIEAEWIRRLPGIWQGFCHGTIQPREQNHSEATYCARRQDTDGQIDWRSDATSIDRFIRAQAAPYPRAFFMLGEQKIRVVTHSTDDRLVYGTAGQVFELGNGHVTICCGQNSALRLTELEVDGKTVSAREVLRSVKTRL